MERGRGQMLKDMDEYRALPLISETKDLAAKDFWGVVLLTCSFELCMNQARIWLLFCGIVL
jgi:hypothetical protein